MRNYLAALILLILFSTSVCALTATTFSGMIQLNLEKIPTTFEKSIGVKNENNETVQVQFTPEPEIESMVVLEAHNITLQPGEQRFVKFNLTITEMKNLTSAINMVFSRPNVSDNTTEEKFGISTKIIVVPRNESVTKDVNITIHDPSQNNPGTPVNQTPSVNQTPTANLTGNNEPSGKSYLAYGAIGVAVLILAAFIILKIMAGAKNE